MRSDHDVPQPGVSGLSSDSGRIERQWRTFDAVLSHTPDCISVWDPQVRLIYANRTLLDLWRTTLEDAAGKTLFDLDPPALTAQLYRHMHQAMATGRPVRDSTPFTGATGETREWEYILTPVFDSSGKIEVVAATSRDVTETRRVHDELVMFRQLAEQSPDFVGIANVLGEAIYLNEAGRRSFGLESPEAIRNLRIVDFFQPKDRALISDTVIPALLTDGHWAGEVMFRHLRTDELIPMFYSTYAIRDGEGQILSLATISRDLREEKKSREALRASEERLAFALQAAGGVGTWDWDLQTDLFYCNERFANLFSVDPARAAVAGVPSSDYIAAIHPSDRPSVLEKIRQSIAVAGPYTAEYRLQRSDGSEFWVCALGHAYNDAEGMPSRMPGVLIDITERKQTEEALKRARDEARTILESITDGFVVLDRDWRFIYVNPAGEQLLGARREDLLGRNQWDLYPGTRGTLVEREYLRAVRDRVPVEFEYLDDARQRCFAFNASPTQEGGLSIYFRDVTERNKADRELRRQWHTFDTALSHTPDFTYIFDLEGRFTYVNRALLSLWQIPLDDALGKNFFDLNYPAELAGRLQHQIQQVVDTRQALRDHTPFTGPTGETRHYEYIFVPVLAANGQVDAVAGSTRDVTERKQAEEQERERQEQLRESARLESLGVMAGGIAHDFNNLLVGILGNASLLAETAQEIDQGIVSEIVLAAERAGDLTRQMLAYSGKGRFVIDVLDLNTLIRENLALLRASLSRSVTVELELGCESCLVEVDRAQIQQVIMNLLINASEAVGDRPGTVSIGTGIAQRSLSRFSARIQTVVPAGKYVLLEIRDDGGGMDPATLKRIFDPFFTTKFTGRGLGLAAVLGIVRGHRGDLEVESHPGRGTTFRIFLPASDRAGLPEKHTDFAPAIDAAGQSVLVVDDEPIVLRVASAALESRGFRVIVARNGEEAIETLRVDGGISLVILDLTMPVMTGAQAIPLIRASHPELPVILSSGFSEAEISRRFATAGLAGFLQKPYSAQAVVAKVNHALQRNPSRS